MRRMVSAVCIVLLAVAHVVSLGRLEKGRSTIQDAEQHLYVMPSSILKVVALDYDGLVSDFLFIDGMAYMGALLRPKESGSRFRLTESQWRGLYQYLDVSSEMDPYFQDPYYIANAFLTWDAGLIRETNALLERGIRSRDWDWTMPFFAGFNYFYFLQENDAAAELLMEASRRPGASPTLASLASKLAFKAKKTENSIVFLEGMIKKTDDEQMKKVFETRVDAFKAILALERAVDAYRARFKRAPQSLTELINAGLVAEMPVDPYGGRFYIDEEGAVRTTSEERLMPHLNLKKKRE